MNKFGILTLSAVEVFNDSVMIIMSVRPRAKIIHCCSGKPASPGVTIGPLFFLSMIRGRAKTIHLTLILFQMSFALTCCGNPILFFQGSQSSSLKCSCALLAVESSCCNFVKIVNPFQDSDASDGCLATLHTSLQSDRSHVELLTLILKRMVSLWSVIWSGATGLLR